MKSCKCREYDEKINSVFKCLGEEIHSYIQVSVVYRQKLINIGFSILIILLGYFSYSIKTEFDEYVEKQNKCSSSSPKGGTGSILYYDIEDGVLWIR